MTFARDGNPSITESDDATRSDRDATRSVRNCVESLRAELDDLVQRWCLAARELGDPYMLALAPALSLTALRGNTIPDEVLQHYKRAAYLLDRYADNGINAAALLFAQRYAFRNRERSTLGNALVEPTGERPPNMPPLLLPMSPQDIAWDLVQIAQQALSMVEPPKPAAYWDLVWVLVRYLTWRVPRYPPHPWRETELVDHIGNEVMRVVFDEDTAAHKIVRKLLLATEPKTDVERALNTLSKQEAASAGEAPEADVRRVLDKFEDCACRAPSAFRDSLLYAAKTTARSNPSRAFRPFLDVLYPYSHKRMTAEERSNRYRVELALRQRITAGLVGLWDGKTDPSPALIVERVLSSVGVRAATMALLRTGSSHKKP